MRSQPSIQANFHQRIRADLIRPSVKSFSLSKQAKYEYLNVFIEACMLSHFVAKKS